MPSGLPAGQPASGQKCATRACHSQKSTNLMIVGGLGGAGGDGGAGGGESGPGGLGGEMLQAGETALAVGHNG
jgi:hypothetical protein